MEILSRRLIQERAEARFTLPFLGYENQSPYDDNVRRFGDDGKLVKCVQTYYIPTVMYRRGAPDGHANISIIQDSPGVYTISVSETNFRGTFVANGKVEVSDNGDFTVNGVVNGALHSENELFAIYPHQYRRFFKRFV